MLQQCFIRRPVLPDVLGLVRFHEIREVIDDIVAVVGAEDRPEPTDGRQRQQGTEKRRGGEGGRRPEEKERDKKRVRSKCVLITTWVNDGAVMMI